MDRLLREDTHKKKFFIVIRPLRFYPPYTNGLVVHATKHLVMFFYVFPKKEVGGGALNKNDRFTEEKSKKSANQLKH